MSLVGFVKNRTRTVSSINQDILETLKLINYSFRKEIKNVLIKPNLCYYWDYSTGQTTDPIFLAALATVLREKISPHVNISVAESDASAVKCRHAFKILGYEKMAEKYNLKLVNLSEDDGEKVEVSSGGQSFRFVLPQTIANADLRINVAKIKYMSHTKISCALKNVFGCNPYQAKFRYHSRINETIVALNKIMKFDLCLLDGITVVGSGARKLGLIMASEDPVAFDSAAARIAGVNPKSVKHIVLASKEGLGSIFFAQKGEQDVKFFAKNWPKTKPSSKVFHLAYEVLTKAGLINTDNV
jgi:uncharacterized protein (DUF362 family)